MSTYRIAHPVSSRGVIIDVERLEVSASDTGCYGSAIGNSGTVVRVGKLRNHGFVSGLSGR